MSRSDLKILVGIANFGTKNQWYLRRLLHEYRRMPHKVDLCVFSNIPKSLGEDVEVCMGLPEKDPWSLPHAHKKVFADRADRYDLFIYSEDDTLITREAVDAFMEVSAVLPDTRIAGFIRYELDGDGRRSYSTIHSHFHWVPDSVQTYGHFRTARLTNEHSGCYMATRRQLHRAVASGGYLIAPSEGRYDKLCT
ncbi:MAG: methyltransferase type 11, partial [Chitinivibrionales bacterium]|nr:methyltransferase type 11 [Chitinivibrionales bacterium]MBD3358740.1 methyltransferase type 11 [Chitinivibrionales bacterium]